MRNNNYHTVGPISKSNRKIVDTDKFETLTTGTFPGLIQALQYEKKKKRKKTNNERKQVQSTTNIFFI